MKKMLALILALVMSLSLVACGGSDAPAEDTSSEDTSSETVEELPYYEWSLSCEYSAENHQTKALEDAAKQARREAELLEEYRQKYSEQKKLEDQKQLEVRKKQEEQKRDR